MTVPSPSTRLRYSLYIGFALFFASVTLSFLLPTRRWSSSSIAFLQEAVVDEADIRPNAAIVIMISPRRLTETLMALKNIEDRFNRRLKYPYVLLTDSATNISDELSEKVRCITEGRATIAHLPEEMWAVPDWLDQERIRHSLDSIGFSLAYRSMCRFYSGFFWRHPALISYDWLWRLDTDITFHCDVQYDPIRRMIKSGALYGFVQVSGDAIGVQESLARNVSQFLHSRPELLVPDANLAFSWKNVSKALQGQADNDDWTVSVMYNNFEISHRSVWSSPTYQAFFEYLDQQGGFFYERWGDAPVHSYGVSMVLKKDQAIQFSDLGYQHKDWGYECPSQPQCACVKEGPSAGKRFPVFIRQAKRMNIDFNNRGDR
ncbi:nucleotide-diphospho-sugar transferase [Pluteus cervinus]|uniref:Nucleotide-diphospho-sugar transferase n=1 Tax=Pluteus cervinus TaxID=181527 RepID=A0ACD3A918_9AGAR|nr:nucleotide-diphospho-sugar transferase [Pluteus cervinus]